MATDHDPSGRAPRGYLPLPGPVFVPERRSDRGVWLPAPAGTPVHAVAGGEVAAVRRDGEVRVVEVDGDDGRRYAYSPLARTYVAYGGVVPSGHVIGVLAEGDEPGLELTITDASGETLDPRPLLVGLADPNELGYDAATSSPIDPNDGAR